HVLTATTDEPASWIKALERQVAAVETTSVAEGWQAHVEHWGEFWARSHIVVTERGVEGGGALNDVSAAYARQRYLTACSGRGAYPIKFNGGLFTADWEIPGQAFDADYRRWGGPYWFQNTRLAYWPML